MFREFGVGLGFRGLRPCCQVSAALLRAKGALLWLRVQGCGCSRQSSECRAGVYDLVLLPTCIIGFRV